MIEYVLMAFFVARPVPTAAPAPGASPPRKEAPRLSDPVEITSRRVTGSRQQAVFSGDVVVKQRTMELRCDDMTASYTGSREVTRVECAGHMRLVEGERTAQGERAVLDVPTGRVVVTGQPEARDSTTFLRGSEVRLLRAGQTLDYEVDDALVTLEAAPLSSPHKAGSREGAAQRLPAEITARKVIGSRTQAVFTGDVVVKHRTLELRCDKMTAFYTASREVTRAECVGHVRAQDGTRQARGERAEFNVPTGVLRVTGNPEARDATTRLRGSEVRMTIGDANFEVKDAVVTVESAPSAPRSGQTGKGPAGKAPDDRQPGSTQRP
jgi:lipopolysaccharide transport protein LptA